MKMQHDEPVPSIATSHPIRDLLDDARAIMVNIRDEFGWECADEWIKAHDNQFYPPKETSPDAGATIKPMTTISCPRCSLLMARCARIEEDFNEARLELLTYFAREHLTCGWCGEMMPAPKGFTPPMTAEKVEQIARLHMIDCPDHPIRETERVLAEERQWLADTMEALKKVKAERDAAIRAEKTHLR